MVAFVVVVIFFGLLLCFCIVTNFFIPVFLLSLPRNLLDDDKVRILATGLKDNATITYLGKRDNYSAIVY